MMRDRRTELLQRQRHLRLRSAELRRVTANQALVLKTPLATIDQVYAGVRWLQSNPLWPAGVVLLLTVWRPRQVLRLTARIWWGWGVYQRARQWLAEKSVKPF
jgi:hypothetical protein